MKLLTTVSSVRLLVHAIQLLHNHCSCSTATVTDGSHTILARLELVQEGDKDTRAGATQSMAQGDSTTQQVDLGVLQAEDLVALALALISKSRKSGDIKERRSIFFSPSRWP